MNRRTKIKILVVLALILIVVFGPPLYDWYMDEFHANPGYNGMEVYPRYDGGFYWISVDRAIPKSKVVVNFKTSAHDTNRTHTFSNEHDEMYFSCAEYWLVEEVYPGPDKYERVQKTLYWYIAIYKIIKIYESHNPITNISCTIYKFDFIRWDLILTKTDCIAGEYTSPEYYVVTETCNVILTVEGRGWI